jgi:hypothetical protein
MLPESGFSNQFPLMFHVKNQNQPILAARPAILAGPALLPLGSDAIFNEAGKRSVKAMTPVQGFRSHNESSG